MSKKFQHILLEVKDEVATVTLNRPEVHNAFSEVMIAELQEAFGNLAVDANTRVVLVKGAGKNFCAGADLHWMKKVAGYSEEENIEDAKGLSLMLRTIDECPKPVVMQVHGAAIGGGTGLVAVADIAIASEEATFAFSEVRLGLVPAVISPFVLRKIGSRYAREYFLTAERFSASIAQQMGLVQYQVPADQLEEKILEKIKMLKQGAKGALADAKKLVRLLPMLLGQQEAEVTSKLIAMRRASDEGKEGIQAFFEKRKPHWNNPK